ncbi:hypothetical protein BHE74_00010201 [Ensete ventricosum]|nr:hypothetical protein BHE74_00010201 [Ensete ventricosum]
MLQDMEELMSLGPEKLLLKWMNFHLKKAGYKKTVTNFSSDVKDNTLCFVRSDHFKLSETYKVIVQAENQ